MCVAAVYIYLGEYEVQEFAFLVTNQVQLKTIVPPHSTLATCCHILKHFITMNAFVVVYRNAGAVYEADIGAFAKTKKLEEKG